MFVVARERPEGFWFLLAVNLLFTQLNLWTVIESEPMHFNDAACGVVVQFCGIENEMVFESSLC